MLRHCPRHSTAAQLKDHTPMPNPMTRMLARKRGVHCLSSTPADPEVAERVVLREWNTSLHKQCLQWQQGRAVVETQWLASALHISSQVAQQHCRQEDGLQVLLPWVTRAADIQLVQQAGHQVVAVQPAWQLVELLVQELQLQAPLARAHDGWERYTSPNVLLYRGGPYSLTPPVLSLAGEVQVVLDRWGLLITPPSLVQRYLATIGALLPKGAVYAAAIMDPSGSYLQGGPATATAEGEESAGGSQHGPQEQIPCRASTVDVSEVARHAAVANLELKEVSSTAGDTSGCQLLVLCKQQHY